MLNDDFQKVLYILSDILSNLYFKKESTNLNIIFHAKRQFFQKRSADGVFGDRKPLLVVSDVQVCLTVICQHMLPNVENVSCQSL